ncbi:hypothetical protein PIIN_10317 [Serendipita indica DSM 11827]|uniref:Uncharacterized protein n=1 Tax=Serendipita indica (strain DSM 11827) TaxID=1109443 RepID=G4TYC9_SERID|nr:hypothetical protein PIIN_10317 [Serendipita indica DSM 11827]
MSVWFSLALVLQFLCITMVSFIISLRLLYFMLAIWFASLCASFGLIVESMWAHSENLMCEVSFNVFLTVSPTFGSNGSRRQSSMDYTASSCLEARKLAMAIPYRDGIIFYAGTFSITLAVLATWHFASRVYIGVTVYAPWIAFQIAISWILLDFRTSQVFERASHQRQAHIHMAGIIAPRERESQQGASTQLIYTSDSRDAGHKAPISSGLSAWLKRPSQYG